MRKGGRINAEATYPVAVMDEYGSLFVADENRINYAENYDIRK